MELKGAVRSVLGHADLACAVAAFLGAGDVLALSGACRATREALGDEAFAAKLGPRAPAEGSRGAVVWCLGAGLCSACLSARGYFRPATAARRGELQCLRCFHAQHVFIRDAAVALDIIPAAALARFPSTRCGDGLVYLPRRAVEEAARAPRYRPPNLVSAARAARAYSLTGADLRCLPRWGYRQLLDARDLDRASRAKHGGADPAKTRRRLAIGRIVDPALEPLARRAIETGRGLQRVSRLAEAARCAHRADAHALRPAPRARAPAALPSLTPA